MAYIATGLVPNLLLLLALLGLGDSLDDTDSHGLAHVTDGETAKGREGLEVLDHGHALPAGPQRRAAHHRQLQYGAEPACDRTTVKFRLHIFPCLG